MFEFSIIIPVYNRPEELRDLLDSLCSQTAQAFEVIVVDDGSSLPSGKVSDAYLSRLPLSYFHIQNCGPGQARNYGCSRAGSDFFLFFDSDCSLPEHYIQTLQETIAATPFDAFGGPDRDLPSFRPLQRAISYSMTSALTTGGIRGGAISPKNFHPRSFNMGFSRQVYQATGGFSVMRFGEDIDLSIRIREAGFRSTLLRQCYVYHKRRTNFRSFFKQVFNSGMARINLYRRHPSSLRTMHFLPALYCLYALTSFAVLLFTGAWEPLLPLILYHAIVFFDSLLSTGNPLVAFFSVMTVAVQHTGYGLGFIRGFIERIMFRLPENHAFKKSFYR